MSLTQQNCSSRFQFGRWGGEGYWYTIVGVVKEIRERGVAEEPGPTVYRLHEQADQSNDEPSGIVVRTAVEPASIVGAIRQAIWSVDRNQPVARVLSYAVTQRTNEIGVRVALGATSRDILLSFGGRGLTLTLVGLGMGAALAALAALACLVPARRASRIDPVRALKHE